MQQLGTYQTRTADYAGLDRSAGDAVLAAYGELYGRVQRKLFAEVAAGRSTTSLKSAYLERYGIPARMFNAVRVSLDGKIASVRETMGLRRESLQRRIARAEEQTADAAEHGRLDQVHHKKRRLANLRHRLSALEADIAAGRVRLCFGSKRLWRKQHNLEANGYASHQEWLRDWRDARSDEFFVLGSRDETAGCQLCVASVADDGTLTLRLRMPDCLAGATRQIPGHPRCEVRLRPRAGAGCPPKQRRLRRSTGVSTVKRRRGQLNWARPSATGSSGTERAGGYSLPPT